jgi:hypothetical protein
MEASRLTTHRAPPEPSGANVKNFENVARGSSINLCQIPSQTVMAGPGRRSPNQDYIDGDISTPG